ncbi:hypothetical protein [Parafrankia sp. FMc2]
MDRQYVPTGIPVRGPRHTARGGSTGAWPELHHTAVGDEAEPGV